MAGRNKPHKRSRRGCLAGAVRIVVLAGLVAGVVVFLLYATWASLFDLDQVGTMPQRSIVYDLDGKPYSRLHGENRIVVPIEKVSEHFVNALLAREDARFYNHLGIDPIGIARAMVRNVLSGSLKEGGSTITQQLARNTFPLGGKTFHRKALEAFVALRIERKFTKKEILGFYVNRIYFGSGMYGVETASQAYFGKPSQSMSMSEGALMAGLIRSPTRFSPLNNREAAIRERNIVLDRMATVGMISEKQAESVKRWPVKINRNPARSSQENYAMDAIARDLDLILADRDLDEGGLRIYTTIDPRMTAIAEQALEQHIASVEDRRGFGHPRKADFSPAQREREEAPQYLQGSVVLIDNRTGGIRALVGGRDYRESKLNRAVMSKRQVGSSFKPFVYAAAFNRGMLPGMAVSDGPIEPGEIRTAATSWSPGNSDGEFGGILPAEDGLIRSRNTMSVRVGEFAGIDEVRRIGTLCGLGDSIPRMPSIYLGAFESTLKDLTCAYTVFPNSGVRRQSYLIERIDDEDANPIYRAAHVEMRALDPAVAEMTTSVLEEVIQRGTAASAKSLGLKVPAAGKTGTTDNYHDAWFIGFTSALTCGVWVGLDQPQPIVARGYGSTLALPVWVKVISQAPPNRYPANPLPLPVATARVELCSVSNLLATVGCRAAGVSYSDDIPQSLVPAEPCAIHRGAIAREPGRKPPPLTPQRIFDTFRQLFRRN